MVKKSRFFLANSCKFQILIQTGTLVLALLCNKACFFVRTPITLTLTPLVARYVQKLGINPGKAAVAEAAKKL